MWKKNGRVDICVSGKKQWWKAATWAQLIEKWSEREKMEIKRLKKALEEREAGFDGFEGGSTGRMRIATITAVARAFNNAGRRRHVPSQGESCRLPCFFFCICRNKNPKANKSHPRASLAFNSTNLTKTPVWPFTIQTPLLPWWGITRGSDGVNLRICINWRSIYEKPKLFFLQNFLLYISYSLFASLLADLDSISSYLWRLWQPTMIAAADI